MKKSLVLRENPMAALFVFIAANTIISYSRFSIPVKGWVFFAGVLIPAVLLLLSRDQEKNINTTAGNPGDLSLDLGFWIAGGAAALYLRFFKLTSFRFWPTGDEGLHGFLAIPLARQWDWQFFYTVGEHPPLLIWIMGLCFKMFNSPFFNLWFFPAFFSSLAVPVGYLAARRFYPKSFCLLFAGLLAFSFWPLYFGRYCHQGIFIPFWELFSFLLLALWIKNKNNAAGGYWAAFLGLWTGLGTLTFPSWLLVGAILLASVWVILVKDALRPLYYFGAALALGLIPLVSAILREGYGHHLLDSSQASPWFSNAHRLLTHFSYFTSLLWGPLEAGGSYGPVWGGMLNPVLGACFLLGLIHLYHHRHEGIVQWIILSLVVCSLPAVLAADYVELNRLIQVMPFLLLVSALGIYRLTLPMGKRKKIILITLLGLASFSLDLNHLRKAMEMGQPVPGNMNDIEKDYEFFKAESLKSGQGLIFTDFLTLNHGHSLAVATYPFNSASNPRLNPEKAQWAGIITNVFYLPYLRNQFPEAKWRVSSGEVLPEEGRLMAGIIPLGPTNRDLFKRWNKAHDYFHQMNLEAEKSFNGKENFLKALEGVKKGEPFVAGDRFLESCFWEWAAQYYYDPLHNGNIYCMFQAIQKGYPAAHLYSKLGEYFLDQNMRVEAQEAFRDAEAQKEQFLKQEGSSGENK